MLLCRNLPFVGFTFTSDKGKVGGLGKNDTQGLEAELKAKAAELEKMKLKNFQLEQQVIKQLKNAKTNLPFNNILQALNHTRVAEGSVREFEQVCSLTVVLIIKLGCYDVSYLDVHGMLSMCCAPL